MPLNFILISLMFSCLLSLDDLDFIYLSVYIRNCDADMHLLVFSSIHIVEISCSEPVAIIRMIFLYYYLSIIITIMSFIIMKSIHCKFHQNYYFPMYLKKKSQKKVAII